jgi:hypothetical protein
MAGFVVNLTGRYRHGVPRPPADEPADDPADDPADALADPLTSRRARTIVLGGLALIAVLGCLLLAFDLNNQGAWGCRSVPIDDAAPGSTAREAVDHVLATGIAPTDGWSPAEPNRFVRSVDGTQMVLDLNQSDARTFTVVRLDTCGPGLAPR